MSLTDAILLIAGGFAAGIVNTLAGGASILTVPLLITLGVPGTLANGTNRIGIVVQCAVGAWRFRSAGFSGFGASAAVLVPVVLGSIVGAMAAAQLADAAFERTFGLIMLAMLVPILRPPRVHADARPLGPSSRFLLFFAIGLYGGAFQAGVGIFLVLALARAGYGLVLANSVKVVVTLALTLAAVPVYLIAGQVLWVPGLLLAVGSAAGAELGVRWAVASGERIIRPVLAASVLVLAARMLSLL